MLLSFFAYCGVLNGLTPSEVVEKVEAELLRAVTFSWTLLPLSQLAEHRLASKGLRECLVYGVVIVYATFLSVVGHRSLSEPVSRVEIAEEVN